MADYEQNHYKNPSKVFSFHDDKKTDSNQNNYYNQSSTDKKEENIYELKNKINKYNLYDVGTPVESYNVSSELRLVNIERRLEKNEKLLNFFEEMLRLKEDEKKNDIQIEKNIIKDLTMNK